MKSRRLRALRDELIGELDLDRSATTETVCLRLCQIVAQRLRREIRLRFDDLGDSGVSGLWAVLSGPTQIPEQTPEQTGEVHVIIVTTTRSWMHRLLILTHELAHMLCAHTPARLDAAEASRLLYPDLSPAMLRILAGRTNLNRREEREADHVAGALTRGLIAWARQQQVRPFAVDDNDLVAKAWYTLGYSPQRGPK